MKTMIYLITLLETENCQFAFLQVGYITSKIIAFNWESSCQTDLAPRSPFFVIKIFDCPLGIVFIISSIEIDLRYSKMPLNSSEMSVHTLTISCLNFLAMLVGSFPPGRSTQ